MTCPTCKSDPCQCSPNVVMVRDPGPSTNCVACAGVPRCVKCGEYLCLCVTDPSQGVPVDDEQPGAEGAD